MKILVSIHSPFLMWNIPGAHVQRLRAEFPQHTFLHAGDDAAAVDAIADADIAFSSQVGPAQLAAARRLRWIHSPAAGVGAMLFPEMVASPVVMTNSRGLAADVMAEHVVAVTLALLRRLPLAVRRQIEHTWAQDEISAPPGKICSGMDCQPPEVSARAPYERRTPFWMSRAMTGCCLKRWNSLKGESVGLR